MSIMRDDGASSAGPCDDDRLMFNSMTQKSSREKDWDEESAQCNATVNGSLDKDAIQDL